MDSNGNPKVYYQYDAWGNILSTSGSMASTLGTQNPLRYRGYVYDEETGLYYLQSRYYNPEIGRFLNADGYIATGQGLLGNNMFAYCLNNPVRYMDYSGFVAVDCFDTDEDLLDPEDDTNGGGGFAGFLCSVLSLVNSFGHSMNAGLTGMNMASGAGGNGITIAAGVHSGSFDISACFVAGTTVQCESGAVPIEYIQEGDFVWAWDEETGEVALKQVIETYVNETDELVHIFVNGEEIVTTPGHPFYSPVKGWTDAVQLRAGDILVLVNGEYVVVEKVQHEILEAPVTVYNLQVEDYHTYYVTNAGVLVHNKCTLDEVLEGAKDTTRSHGNTTNYEKSGDYSQATSDFNYLNQGSAKAISTAYGNGWVGTYNGSNLVVRPGSATGFPTLELQFQNSNVIKIRYVG